MGRDRQQARTRTAGPEMRGAAPVPEITIVRRPDADQAHRETRTVETTSVDPGTTGLDLFGDDRSIVAMRVDGETRDLHRDVPPGSEVEPVLADSEEGLSIVRHSCAHVLAQAVQDAYADARLGIGPPIVDGFYYDFDVDEPFTPEDLKALEKAMQRIV